MHSKFRSFFWPIEKHELIRILPMALMMFCFLFNYTILRDLKDTLILNSAGAEAIPFIKFWGTLPAALLFVILYAKMSNRLRPKTLYTVTVLPFLIFSLLFGFVLYPLKDIIHPTTSAHALHHWLLAHCPTSMHTTLTALVHVYKNWTFSVFYIIAEIWGSMGIGLLFWQFANDITTTDEAKRFYPRFTQFGNFGLLASGYALLYFSRRYPVDQWDITIKWLMAAAALNFVLLLAVYHFIHWHRRKTGLEARVREKKEKPKLSIKESFLFLAKSKYLGLITLLVLGYGIATNLIEVAYKNQLRTFFPTTSEMSAFYGKLSMSIGITTFLMVVCSGFILNRVSWRAAALATPLFMLVTGGIFFTTLLYKEAYQALFHVSPLLIGIIVGSFQFSLSKGVKYALFDPSKEMAYIPLDQESKVKGKAAIEVIGSRLGKSGGGLFLQCVLLFGAISDNIGILYIAVTTVIALWVVSVFRLNRRYLEKTQEITTPKETPALSEAP